MVYVFAGPAHPFSLGTTVMVAVIGEEVLFTAVKLGTLPVPFAGSPIDVLELVQVKLAPAGVLPKFCADTVAPAHIIKLPGTITSGRGFMVMV